MANRCTQWPTSAFGVGDALRSQSVVGCLPGGTGVIGAEHAGCGDGHEHASRIVLVQDDGVQAHPTGTGLPAGPRTMAAQAGQLLPTAATVVGAEQRSVLHPGVNRLRVGQ